REVDRMPSESERRPGFIYFEEENTHLINAKLLSREHRANQVARVTVPVTTACHIAGDGKARSSARSRSAHGAALGRERRGRWPQVRLESARSASSTSSSGGALPMSHHVEGQEGAALAALGKICP